MNDILKRAEELTAYAKAHLELDERDGFYVKNRLLEILQNCENEELSEEADEVYGVLSLLPSAINRRFSEIYQESGSKAATDWFYNYCVHNEYVKNMEFLGKLLNKSHESLSKLYEVTGRELDALAYAAQEHPACAGSRMTGGGFGGCTISLVKTAEVEDFKNVVLEKYERATGYRAGCYKADVSDGITVEKL